MWHGVGIGWHNLKNNDVTAEECVNSGLSQRHGVVQRFGKSAYIFYFPQRTGEKQNKYNIYYIVVIVMTVVTILYFQWSWRHNVVMTGMGLVK